MDLDALGRDVGFSRSVFAARFSHYVGIAPMRYLAAGACSWRSDGCKSRA
jgi:AraC-like DNA-binding protein